MEGETTFERRVRKTAWYGALPVGVAVLAAFFLLPDNKHNSHGHKHTDSNRHLTRTELADAGSHRHKGGQGSRRHARSHQPSYYFDHSLGTLIDMSDRDLEKTNALSDGPERKSHPIGHNKGLVVRTVERAAHTVEDVLIGAVDIATDQDIRRNPSAE